MTAPTDSLAAVRHADIATFEASLAVHRRSLRRSVRTYRATLREPEGCPPNERQPRLAEVRAAIRHDTEKLRIHTAKLAEARTRLAEYLSAWRAA